MRKLAVIALLLLSVITLSGCKNEIVEVTEISFNGKIYEKISVTDDNYDLFDNNGHSIEIFFDDEGILISTEIDEDIYFITGTIESYQIKKNGETLLLCSGDPIVCSGFEDVSFKLDIMPIIIAYHNSVS